MTWRETIRPQVEEAIREAMVRLGPNATPNAIAREVNANRPASMKSTRGWLDRIWRNEVRIQLALGPTRQQLRKRAERRERAASAGQMKLFEEGES